MGVTLVGEAVAVVVFDSTVVVIVSNVIKVVVVVDFVFLQHAVSCLLIFLSSSPTSSGTSFLTLSQLRSDRL